MSGPLFVASEGQIQSPGVAAVEVQAPTLIDGIPNGRIGLVGQFGWGPANQVYEPADSADFLATFEPPGSPRSSSGYHQVMRRAGLSLAIYRPLKGTPVKASATIAGTSGNVNVTAKYYGVLGNSIQIIQEPSSDGVSGSKRFWAVLTNAITGTTRELIADNVAPPNGGGLLTVDTSASLLIGSFTVDSALTAFASDATTSLTSGSNGSSLTSTEYSAGMDALDVLDEVACLGVDDCGDSIRAAVNAALLAHANSAAGRYIAFIAGNSGNTWAQVKTDVAGYRLKWVRYCAQWVNVLDDSGAAVLTPGWIHEAAACINLEPQQSHAWWSAIATQYYSSIASLYAANWSASQSGVASDAMNLGIGVFVKLADGRYASQNDRNTDLAVANRFLVTSRIKRFLAESLKVGLADYTNSPGVIDEQQAMVQAATAFLESQVGKRIKQYSIDASTPNTAGSMASGIFRIAIAVQTPAPNERIALLMQVGPTVTFN